MSATTSPLRRFLGFLPFLFVLLFSFGLLMYTGVGDANGVYRKFYVNKAASFGEIVQAPVNTYLLLGFPLIHYAGFETSTGPLLTSEPAIEKIVVNDENGKALFSVAQPGAEARADDSPFTLSPLSQSLPGAAKERPPQVYENRGRYKISFPLESRIGVVGTLDIYAYKAIADRRIFNAFLVPGIAALALLVVFALLGVFLFRKSGRGSRVGVQASFTVAFLALAGFIVFGLVNLYREGIGDKTEALTRSLVKRIDAAVALGIDLDDLTGLDGVFNEYTRIDPDIQVITLKRGGTDVLSVRSEKPAAEVLSLTTALLEIDIPFSTAAGGSGAGLHVSVGIPMNRIYEQLLRSGKNFIVLFVSCIFLSVLFLNIIFAVRRKNETAGDGQALEADQELKLELIRPLYFLAVFIEGLFTSFLPQYFQRVAEQSGLGPEASSMLFTIYFAAFVFALLPTGKLAERGRIKWLLVLGLCLCASSYVMLALLRGIEFVIASRVMAGLGQGVLFICIQSYILRTARAKKKTQGSGIIVFGYNGGIIAGTALGALMVSQLGDEGVFLLAGIAGGLVILYTLVFVQPLARLPRAAKPVRREGAIRSFFRTWADWEFVRTILFVGFVTKAILTGVNSFALPLILSGMNYLKEDIGQILIFYSGAVLIATKFISPLIDRFGRSRGFLFAGTQLGGLTLYAMGFILSDLFASQPLIRTLLLIGGMVLLGFGHGFIHAPVVTHVANTRVAQRTGVSGVTSLYRFLERMGHVAGPLLVGPLLYGLGAGKVYALSWVGIAAVAAGLLFFIGRGAVLPTVHSPAEKKEERS